MDSRVITHAHPSTPPRTNGLHATLDNLGGKLDGVWHDSCAYSNEFRYPKAVMKADSSSPANVILPLATVFIAKGLGVTAGMSGVSNLTDGEFALLAARPAFGLCTLRAPSGRVLGPTMIDRFSGRQSGARVGMRSPWSKPQ